MSKSGHFVYLGICLTWVAVNEQVSSTTALNSQKQSNDTNTNKIVVFHKVQEAPSRVKDQFYVMLLQYWKLMF